MDDDHNQNDLVVLDDTQNFEEKENLYNHNSEPDMLLEPQFEVCWDPNIVNNLEPAVAPNQPQDPSEDEQVKVKIKVLETEIAHCKILITEYEESEVDLNSNSSSYIKSEK